MESILTGICCKRIYQVHQPSLEHYNHGTMHDAENYNAKHNYFSFQGIVNGLVNQMNIPDFE